MKYKKLIIIASTAIVFGTGVAVASSLLENPRSHEIQRWFPGHNHTHGGETVGAPNHSGGTDKYGCHNASVPYHCH